MKTAIRYSINGVSYGSFAYLMVLLFKIQVTPPTAMNIISIWVMSVAIGLLSLVFQSERLSTLTCLVIHFVGSMGLVMGMLWANGWPLAPVFWLVFVLLYLFNWAVIRLNQYLQVEKVNQLLLKRQARQH